MPAGSGLCGALSDTVLLVQASQAVSTSHDALTTMMMSLVDQYSFSLDTAGNAQPYSPRLAILTYSTSVTIVHALSADGASLRIAINSRPSSGGQTCLSCGLEAAYNTLNDGQRSGARKQIIVMLASQQNVQGTTEAAIAAEQAEQKEAELDTAMREYTAGRRYTGTRVGRSTSQPTRTTRTSRKDESIGAAIANVVVKELKGTTGRRIVRGILGSIFGGRR